MKILKEFKTEFGNVAFIGDPYQGSLICLSINPQGEFSVGVINKNEYEDLLKDSEDTIYFAAETIHDSYFKGTYQNNLLTIDIEPSSLFQEHFEGSIISDFKKEIIGLAIATEIYFNQPKEKNLDIFTVPYNRISQSFFKFPLIQKIGEHTFTSLITNRTYSFVPHEKQDPNYSLEWKILENEQILAELTIPPVKHYMILNFINENPASLAEIWDAYLIKQFGIYLTMINAPLNWQEQGYIHQLGLSLDPAMHLWVNTK